MAALAFVIISILVMTGVTATFDRHWLEGPGLWGRADPTRLRLLDFLTNAGDARNRFVVTAVAALALWFGGRRRLAIFLGGTVATGAAVCALLKLLTERARPDLIPHLDHVTSFSYPSGHAWNAVVYYGALAVVSAAIWPRSRALVLALVLILAGLTGFSRIALGVHWPTDVLGGWAGGLAWLFLGWAWLDRGKASSGLRGGRA